MRHLPIRGCGLRRGVPGAALVDAVSGAPLGQAFVYRRAAPRR